MDVLLEVKELPSWARVSPDVIGLAFLVAQLATSTAAAPLPDIEIRARVEAERVEVTQEGKANIALHVEPGQAEPVRVERSAPRGQRDYRNLTIDLKAAVRLTDPAVIDASSAPAERELTGESN